MPTGKNWTKLVSLYFILNKNGIAGWFMTELVGLAFEIRQYIKPPFNVKTKRNITKKRIRNLRKRVL